MKFSIHLLPLTAFLATAFGENVSLQPEQPSRPESSSSIATLVWQDDFENFPDDNQDGRPEWHPKYDGFENDETENWHIIDKAQAEAEGVDISRIYGNRLYRGEITGPDTKSHRAYPLAHFDDEGYGAQLDFPEGIPSPLVNQWYVWWDPQGQELSGDKWMHFATWSNNVNWVVNTLTVVKGDSEPYVLNIAGGKKVDSVEYFADRAVPTRQWIRFTAYIDYSKRNGEGAEKGGLIAVWMNGVLIGIAKGGNLAPDATLARGYPLGTTNLLRAHWGVYASKDCDRGLWYEDLNRIWTLDAPLTNFSKEPEAPPTRDPLAP